MESNSSYADSDKITEVFAWPLPDDEVREALESAYRDGSWGQYHGPHSEGLIADLTQFFGTEHAMLCSSGTVAIELALRGCGVVAGDEVILAGYDFPGNFRAIEAIGARPVLLDVAPNTWCLDAEQLELVQSNKVKAVIVSHLHGGLADMPRIMNIARQRGWQVVEDACQQPGAEMGGRVVGSWGDVGALSFGGSKLLTAGRGGALLSKNAQILQRVKVFADRGNQTFPLSELQAVVLRPQLRKLAERNRVRNQRIHEIRHLTSELSAWLKPVENNSDVMPAYYKFAWSFLPAETDPDMRDKLMALLMAACLPIGTGFRGFTGRSERRCKKVGDLEYSKRLSQSTLLLHHPVLLAQGNAAQQVVQSLAGSVRQLVS